MSSTESSQIGDAQLIKTKDKEAIFTQELLNQLSQCNQPHIAITLNLSFAYSHKSSTYTINTGIIQPAKVSLNALLKALSSFIELSSYSISYSGTQDSDVFFYCGQYPFDNHLVLCEITPTRELWLRLRPDVNDRLALNFDLYADEIAANMDRNNQDDSDKAKTNYYINENSSRANERVIGDIIKKVHLWYRLHHGVKGKNNALIRLTYQEAADYIPMSKKTLSNYYEQLKLGKMFGFDFNQNKNSKVSVLKKFIKNHTKDVNTSMIRRVKSRKSKEIVKMDLKQKAFIAGLTVIDDAFSLEDVSL